MKLLLVILASAVLSGCVQFNAMVTSYGAQAAKQALTVAEYTLCDASPVGAIRARYNDPEKMAAWQALCSPANDFTLVEAE